MTPRRGRCRARAAIALFLHRLEQSGDDATAMAEPALWKQTVEKLSNPNSPSDMHADLPRLGALAPPAPLRNLTAADGNHLDRDASIDSLMNGSETVVFNQPSCEVLEVLGSLSPASWHSNWLSMCHILVVCTADWHQGILRRLQSGRDAAPNPLTPVNSPDMQGASATALEKRLRCDRTRRV